MKSPLLLLSFLFLACTLEPLLCAEPLLDNKGEKVLSGTPYYIVSTIRGAGGGGLSLTIGRNVCPLDVMQESLDVLRGIPLILSPAVENEDVVVYESTDLNIEFSTRYNICSQSTVWKVDDYDKSKGEWFITTNGVKGNPGAVTLQNWFKFEKVQNTDSYRIVHCPTVCDSCVTLCSNVGIQGTGKRLLALKHEHRLLVHFIKADEYANIKIE